KQAGRGTSTNTQECRPLESTRSPSPMTMTMKQWFARWWPSMPKPTMRRTSDADIDALQRKLEIAQAVELERQRIHDDLHDDIGGKLLTLLHRVHEPAQQQLVRELLQDLRAILARSRGAEGSLLEVLALLREEAEHRLEAQSIALDWQQAEGLPDPDLDQAQARHLLRIGREAITNSLRHARPHRLRVV